MAVNLNQSKYGFRELEELWIAAGGNKNEAPTAAAIALAESGGNPRQESSNANGSIDRGLWQINSVHGSLSTTDVRGNAIAAVKIFRENQGWSPWTTYKNKAYLRELNAHAHEGINLEKAVEPQSGLFGVFEGKVPFFSKEGKTEENLEHKFEKFNPLDWGQELGEILGFLGSAAGWARIGKVLLGGTLLAIAVVELAKVGSGGDTSLPGTTKKVVIGE
jgi:hypothetical protein